MLMQGLRTGEIMPSILLKHYLRIQGINYKQIAQKAGCHPSLVHKIVCGYTYSTKNGDKLRQSGRVEQAIAQCLDISPEKIWGTEADNYLRAAIAQELWERFARYKNINFDVNHIEK
jgi:lambda repressor-like predicted transcriptional regulator